MVHQVVLKGNGVRRAVFQPLLGTDFGLACVFCVGVCVGVLLLLQFWWGLVWLTIELVQYIARLGQAREQESSNRPESTPAKHWVRDAMFQLSLKYTQKWGIIQGRAYRALNVLRQELFRMCEALGVARPL